jgi:hypothetical protein
MTDRKLDFQGDRIREGLVDDDRQEERGALGNRMRALSAVTGQVKTSHDEVLPKGSSAAQGVGPLIVDSAEKPSGV